MPSPQDHDFLAFVVDQLSGLRITARSMFGCFGLYADDDFFAVIDEGRLYFVTDEVTRAAYRAVGMNAFHALKSYYEIPTDVLEDDVKLRKWAREAVEVHRRKNPKRRSKPAARRRT